MTHNPRAEVLASFHDAIRRSDSLTPVGFDEPEPEEQWTPQYRGDRAAVGTLVFVGFLYGLIAGVFGTLLIRG